MKRCRILVLFLVILAMIMFGCRYPDMMGLVAVFVVILAITFAIAVYIDIF